MYLFSVCVFVCVREKERERDNERVSRPLCVLISKTYKTHNTQINLNKQKLGEP